MSICTFPGCGRVVECKSLCKAHYSQQRRGQELRPLRSASPNATCKVDGCDRVLANEKATGRGMCGLHYQRWRKHGDPLYERPKVVGVAPCAVEGCQGVVVARGWCTAHYTRWIRYADPTARVAGEVVDGMRICPQCGVDKRLSEYSSERESWCRPCAAAATRRFRERNPYRPIVTHIATCEYCGLKFGANAKQTLHCSRNCAESNKWRRRKSASEKRRAALRGVDAEDFDRSEIFARDDWMCQLCFEPVDPSLRYPDPMSVSLDHVIPVSRGGSHSRANTQCAHLACNMRKHAKIPADMALDPEVVA